MGCSAVYYLRNLSPKSRIIHWKCSDAAQKLVNAENEATNKDAFAEQAEQIEQAEGEVVAEVEEAAIEEPVKSNNSTVDDAEPTSDHSTEVVPEDEGGRR